MKTTKKLAFFGLTALILAAPLVAATANSGGASTGPACTGSCTQSIASGKAASGSATAPNAADGAQGTAPAGNGVSLSVGQDGVKVSMKGGFTFGKSLLGKVLGSGQAQGQGS